jgi:hypothetical protein
MIRRIAAAAIDLGFILALTLALAPTTGAFFLARTVPTLHVGAPHTLWRGPFPFVLAMLGRYVYGAPFAAALVFLAEPLFGTSAGKTALGLTVVTWRDPTPAEPGVIRYLAKASGPLILTMALLLGLWPVALLGSLLALATCVGSLPLLFGRRALHDFLAGTTVIRKPSAAR